METTTRTAAFLGVLEADAEAEFRYWLDPIAEMTAFGLSPEEQAVIQYGTTEEIRLAADIGGGPILIKMKSGPVYDPTTGSGPV